MNPSVSDFNAELLSQSWVLIVSISGVRTLCGNCPGSGFSIYLFSSSFAKPARFAYIWLVLSEQLRTGGSVS